MIGETFDRLRHLFREGTVWRAEAIVVAVVLIVIAGGVLRFRGLDWDHPTGGASLHMHPDERFLSIVANDLDWPADAGEYFDTAESRANPYNLESVNSFVYGTLPLYLGKAAATVAGDDPAGPGNSYDTSALWGRRLTAAVSTASIALVFLVGWALLSRGVGLLAALLYAISVTPIQLAHFWTVDPYVTFFALTTILFSALLVRDQRPTVTWALFLGIGLSVGLGMASKVAFWPIILAPVVETAARIGLRDFPGLKLRRGLIPRPPPSRSNSDWMTDVAGLLVAALVSLVVFRIVQPNAFVGPGLLDVGINQQWWSDLSGEAGRQSGSSGLPWVIQFADRPIYLESLKNMVFWGMGPMLGVTAWTSLVAAAVVILRKRDLSLLVPVMLPAVFLVYFGGRFVVFMRYFNPVYPLLCLLAAWGMFGLLGWARRAQVPARLVSAASGVGLDARAALVGAAAGVVVLAVVATAWWALAFQNVYSEEHPRIQASRWIYENVAPGAGITNEIWDDSLPMYLPGFPPAHDYRRIPTEPYEPDSALKVAKLVYGNPDREEQAGLEGADYVVLSSDRVRLSVPRLPQKYPATTRYYELLDSGELGFQLVAKFEVRPSFLGISIDDSGAEESFTVYDHPTVRIYQKTPEWSADRAVALLMDAYPDRAVHLTPGQGRTNGLQFTPEEARAQQEGGTFSEVFDAGGPASHWPAVWWFLWLELSAMAALPFTVALFRWLPDRGFALTKLLGPLTVALSVWLLVAWDLFDFSSNLAVGTFVIWLLAGVAAGALWWNRLQELVRRHWRSWLVAEALFIVVFFAFLALRAANPDTWHHPQGGEKPMELSYLTAVVRSTEMPPYDPWFAGGSMNYYYWGWFFLAVPIRALRLLPEVAFNFGVPTYAALAASVAFSTVFNLAALSRRTVTAVSHGWLGPAVAGAFGSFLLVAAGNLDGLHQTVERLQRVNSWGWLDGVPVAGGAVGIAGGAYRFATGTGLPPYDWWRSSRVHFGRFDITEFPYWSFTFGDLHPHLMGLAFLGLIVALAVGCILAAREGDLWRTLIFSAALGLGVALVRAVHTWDLPTAGLVAVAGIVGGQILAPGSRERRAGVVLAQLLIFAAFLVVPLAPYTQHTEVFDSGVMRAQERTPFQQHFAHFGVFMIIATAYLVTAYTLIRRERRAEGRDRSLKPPYTAGAAGTTIFLGAILIVGGLTWSADYTTVAVTVAVELALVNLLFLQWQSRPRDDGALLATALFAAGFAIAAGVDVVTVNGDIVRMNTVFKFSLQAWQLLALGSGFALWFVLASVPRVFEAFRWQRLVVRWSFVAAGLLLAVSAIFIVSGTRARLAARFPHDERGLDGLAYLDVATYREDAGTPDDSDDRDLTLADDRPLIDWLRANVEGSPVIVEAVGPLYHWTGRISMNTGLPAVIGWNWHQEQQRRAYAGLISQRRSDTERFYREADVPTAEAYLRKYNVSYVVVGTEELVYGSEAGLARLDAVPALTEVFRSGDYAIYEVDQSRLPTPTVSLGQ